MNKKYNGLEKCKVCEKLCKIYYSQMCRKCSEKKSNKIYRSKNLDKIFLSSKKYRKQNRSKVNENARNRRNKNHSKLRQYEKEYYLKNHTRLLEKQREYRNKKGINKKGIDYLGVHYDSSWELRVAKALLNKSIKFEVHKQLTTFVGKYYADFYLPDQNIYIEVKNLAYARPDQTEKIKILKNDGLNILILTFDELLKFEEKTEEYLMTQNGLPIEQLKAEKYIPKEIFSKKCIICNCGFETTNFNKIYCSQKCIRKRVEQNRWIKIKEKHIYKKDIILEKNCIVCGKGFKTSNIRKIYCSKVCWNKLYLSRKISDKPIQESA